jgi:hypothetical protein
MYYWQRTQKDIKDAKYGCLYCLTKYNEQNQLRIRSETNGQTAIYPARFSQNQKPVPEIQCARKIHHSIWSVLQNRSQTRNEAKLATPNTQFSPNCDCLSLVLMTLLSDLLFAPTAPCCLASHESLATDCRYFLNYTFLSALCISGLAQFPTYFFRLLPGASRPRGGCCR